MHRSTLARLEHENMVEALVLAGGQVADGRVERDRGVALIATGLPLREFKQVLIESEAAPSEAIAAAVAIMRDRGEMFVVDLRTGIDDRYVPLMAELGLVPLSAGPSEPGMTLHPLPASDTTPPSTGHEIRRVTESVGMTDHISTTATGFGLPVRWIAAIIDDGLVGRSDVALYVGYADGVPVTSGLGVRTGRTIGIYNVATVEAARRQGFGAAMTMRIVDDGAAAGCDVAVLRSSEMGYRIYERLGFRTVVEYQGFVDPASLPSTSAGPPYPLS